MDRFGLLLVPVLVLLSMDMSQSVSAQKKTKKIPDKPDTKLHVPTMTLQEETIIVDLSKPVPETAPVIPLESSLVEEQTNPKKVVIVPAPPPPPGKDPIPPKHPDKP